MKALFAIFLLLISSSCVVSQSETKLGRRGNLGVRPAPLTKEKAQDLGLKKAEGVWIQQVFPGTTAEDAGMQPDDVLQSLNGTPIANMAELIQQLKSLWGGETVTMEVWRENMPVILEGEVVPKPFETSDKHEVLYDQVAFQDGHLRSIITKPKGKGPFPSILFIPGYNCASYDNMSPLHPYKKLIDAFTAKGYVVMRVEKPGMGDGTGSLDCFTCEIGPENDAFLAGFEAMAEYEFVDKDQLFIFGHSLGGINAPVIATQSKAKVKGLIVYGTAYEAWFEYLLRMLRFQNPRTGIDYVQNEKDMRLYHTLLYEHYVLKKTPQELAKNPEYDRILKRDFQYDGGDMIFSRHYRFWQSVNDLNMVDYWSNVDAHVLSIYGEADFEALDPGNHKAIAKIVNAYHPDHGTFLMLPGTNHSMLEVGSMEKGVALRRSPEMRDYLQNHFNYKLIEECDQWMQKLK